jgi:hypothetical protein
MMLVILYLFHITDQYLSGSVSIMQDGFRPNTRCTSTALLSFPRIDC